MVFSQSQLAYRSFFKSRQKIKITMKFIIILFMILVSPILIEALHVECSYDKYYFNPIETAEYRCLVTKMEKTIFSNNPDVTSSSGTHISRCTNDDVTQVIFSTSHVNCIPMRTIPKGLLLGFKYFRFLQFIGCGIKELNGFELIEYPNLEAFSMIGTELETIPKSFFSFTGNIKFIQFERNKIKHIEAHQFKNLVKLQFITFYDEPCVNITIKSSINIEHLTNIFLKSCSYEGVLT